MCTNFFIYLTIELFIYYIYLFIYSYVRICLLIYFQHSPAAVLQRGRKRRSCPDLAKALAPELGDPVLARRERHAAPMEILQNPSVHGPIAVERLRQGTPDLRITTDSMISFPTF